MSQRTDRIDELLRQEIGEIVARDVGDPRIGFATITAVETTRDLSHAIVRVSVIGQPAERAATIAALSRAMPFVRRTLGTRLDLRRVPELHVRLDDTAERGTRILRLIDELGAGHEVDPDAPTAESLPTPVARLPRPGDLADEPPPAVEPPDPRGRRPRPPRRKVHRSPGPRR
jgi:ribosome-binding factor A